MFFFLFRAGKNTAGAVSHEIKAVLLQPKSWRMASHDCKAGVTSIGNVTAVM